MRTAISKDNPFSVNRYGFLWETLRSASPGLHLDYGCYDGETLRTLAETGVISEGVGVDLNVEALERGRPRMPPNVSLQLIEKNVALPFEDGSFDSVCLLDVVEHVVDQKSLLDEVARVLKPSGTAIITVPKQYFLSVLDAGNWKFRFPRLHRWFVTARYGRSAYDARYVNCENGLFGDIEKEKGWHEHFSNAGLEALLKRSGLEVREFDGSGFFYRPIGIVKSFTPRFVHPILGRINEFDAKLFSSANLFCAASKVSTSKSSPVSESLVRA